MEPRGRSWHSDVWEEESKGVPVEEEKIADTSDDDAVYRQILINMMNDPSINKWALISSILLPPTVFNRADWGSVDSEP